MFADFRALFTCFSMHSDEKTANSLLECVGFVMNCLIFLGV